MNKIALITGSASGLGKEFARLLAGEDYDLILVDINKADLEKTSKALSDEFSVNIRSIIQDLGLAESARLVFDQLKDESIDVLINNAGFGISGLFSETDWKLEESMIYLHVFTPTYLSKLIVKKMIDNGSGKIMNISSVAAFTPGPLMNIYYATKAYLLSFGSALSNELKGTGVTITTVCPGLTRTNFSETRASLSSVPAPKFGLLADSSEKVARIAFKAMKKGKPVSVPVFKNRVMSFFTWLFPRPLVIRTIRKSQSKIQNQNT